MSVFACGLASRLFVYRRLLPDSSWPRFASTIVLAQTVCMWLTILQLNCQSPVSCHEQQKFEAVLVSEAKSKEGNEIQHSGLFNVAHGSIVQRLLFWSEKNAMSMLNNRVPFWGLRACDRVASFSDFRKDCDTSTNYYRPEAYPVLSDFFSDHTFTSTSTYEEWGLRPQTLPKKLMLARHNKQKVVC